MSELVEIEATEWGFGATTSAREEVAQMISRAINYLFHNLRMGLPFEPFAILVKHDLEVYLNVARSPGDHATGQIAAGYIATVPGADGAVRALWRSLQSEVPALRAAAVLESAGSGRIATRPDAGTLPVLRLVGDHRQAHPFVANAPWWRAADGLKRGPLRIAFSPVALFGPREPPRQWRRG